MASSRRNRSNSCNSTIQLPRELELNIQNKQYEFRKQPILADKSLTKDEKIKIKEAAIKRACEFDSNIQNKQYESKKQAILADKSLTKDEKSEAIKETDKKYDYGKIPANKKICENCQNEYFDESNCVNCVQNYLRASFSNWTSGNNEIDKLIQECQMKTISPDKIVEWIPYNKLRININKYLTTEICTALWIGEPYKEWDSKEKRLKRFKRFGRHKEVVLKRLKNVESANSSWLEEGESHLTLSNKYSNYIVRCYGLTKDPSGNYMLVIKQMGTDLRQYCYNKLTWQERIKIIDDITEALYRIHIEDKIHRNLHSGNLLFSHIYQRFLISDLGFCGPADRPLNSIYGKLPYIAPEVIAGKEATKASDVYSIGMIMWEISSGQPPFKNFENDDDLAMKIINGMRPEIVPGTPLEYKNLMEQCWNADSTKRPDIYGLINEVYNLYSCRQNVLKTNENEVAKFIRKSKSFENISKIVKISKVYQFKNLPDPRNATEDKDDISKDQNESEILDSISNLTINTDPKYESLELPAINVIPWSNELEVRLCELYMSNDVVDIFWGQRVEEHLAGSTEWHIYVVTCDIDKYKAKMETIASNQVIHFISEKAGLSDFNNTPPSLTKIPQDIQKNFDEALDNELGSSFREAHYNLVGMSTGYKRTNGQLTGIPAILLYVRQKGILRRGCGGIFPKEICGFPTDVVEACVATPCGGIGIEACRRYQGDVKLGSSIGIGMTGSQKTIGTLGMFVRENNMQNRIGIISCEHVLKFQESYVSDKIIYQPSRKDLFEPREKLNELLMLSREPGVGEGEYDDEIEEMRGKVDRANKQAEKSTLATYERGMRENFLSNVDNKHYGIDAAFCVKDDGRRISPDKFPILPKYFEDAKLPRNTCLKCVYTHDELKKFDRESTKIFKVGRTTGLTLGKWLPNEVAVVITDESIKNAEKITEEGNIPVYNKADQGIFIGYMKTQFDAEIRQRRLICYPIKWFDRQMAFRFEHGGFNSGDSGASVVDENGGALGILHSKWDTEYYSYGIASPYFATLEALDVNIHLLN